MDPDTRVLSLMQPLEAFYGQADRAMPPVAIIEGSEMPQPYRTLLVHQGDMTPTLEKFHGQRIHLRVLDKTLTGEVLSRQVVLLTADEKPVEFGAIRIDLALFPDLARDLIRACRVPLGTILNEHGIYHDSRPSGYFRVAGDPFINQALSVEGTPDLYGRCNTLSDAEGRALAEIVEILPPAE